eukprot:scaffold256847_cov32-Tisochrysis_lutea.AAC.1
MPTSLFDNVAGTAIYVRESRRATRANKTNLPNPGTDEDRLMYLCTQEEGSSAIQQLASFCVIGAQQ